MKRRPRIIEFVGLLAAVATLTFFFTGFDFSEALRSLHSFFAPLISNELPEERAIGDRSLGSFVLSWAVMSVFLAGLAAFAQPRGAKLLAFVVGLKKFPLLVLFLLVPVFLLSKEEAQRLAILFVCSTSIMALVIYSLAKYVNKTGRWPRSLSENIFIVGMLVAVPMFPFTAWAVILLLLTLCLSAALNPRFIWGKEEVPSSGDGTTAPPATESAPPTPTTESDAKRDQPQSTERSAENGTVWIMPKGSRFHATGCRYCSADLAISMTRKKAEFLAYKACKACVQ